MGDDEVAMISPSLFGREALPDPGDGLLASAACGSKENKRHVHYGIERTTEQQLWVRSYAAADTPQ